ncbi:hypothetical protein DY000_02040771 [Brassica cretica]|uniref:DUF4005 domain-containing protein n=1 Tax=Brassica cretica TaxID=69181 RepID=A0ABQ7BI35_BRACR|nr:hypothetical protein DY000_02040771 [Brassica cretica]
MGTKGSENRLRRGIRAGSGLQRPPILANPCQKSGTSTVARPQKIKMAKAHRDSIVASFRAAECEIRTEPSTDYLKETDTYPNQPRTNRTTDKPSLVAMHSSQAWSLCTQAKLGRYAATQHAHGLATEFEPSSVAT